MWAFTLKRSSKVTAISSYLKERAKTFGFNGKVHIIPNGVNFSVFRNNFSERDINDTKKKLGFLESDKIIFSASRLVEKNGISDLVQAMAYLSNDFKLVVAGDGEEKENLLNLVQKNGLEKRVCFLGFILQRDLPLWMAISFAFVRPSLSEGLGNSFLEAMAMKLPVIGTAVGGISDFLIDGETGLIVIPGNPQSIAAVVLRLHSDNDLRQKIVQKAFSMVKERYDWNNLSISFKMIFDG
jgi:glycosyltransferase involved in cell wall biosynthesis